MRGVLVRSILVIGVGGLALAGVLYVASTVDARPPEVLSIAVTQPVGGDPGLALITTSIEVSFNEAVETDAAAAIRLEPSVEGTTSWSGTVLIFTPADPLELSTGYEVHVEPGIRDVAGNEMTEVPPAFVFETAGRPRVIGTDPEDGAETVPIEQSIAVTFSTLMDTAVVEDQLRIEPGFSHDLRWAGELLEIVPLAPLRPDTEYEISIGADATDSAGVAMGSMLRFAFRTVEPGLQVDRIVPADRVDGIAPTSAIAVIFDRPIDADSVDGDAFTLTPAVAGSLEVTAVPGEEEDGENAARMLRFVPSGPLPANTTFEVEVAPEIVPEAGGGGMAERLTWTFTTGAPSASISNQITFLTDRSGVTNVWAMNADGTGQHQVSAELAPVLDYAIAPDGSSLVVADGRRLVFLRPDGSDRRVLTGESHLEFDPAYAPNARVVAFGRADAETGSGLGLWQWEVGGSDPEPIEIPGDLGASPSPSPSPSDGELEPILRAPRFAPDGLALAFVDASGSVGVIELPGQRLTRVAFGATGPPTWLPDSSAVLLTGQPDGVSPGTAPLTPIAPLEPGGDDAVFRIARSGTAATETAFGAGWRVVAVAPDGTIAYATDRGRLGVTSSSDDIGADEVVPDARVTDAAFAPGDDAMVIVVGGAEEDPGSLEHLDLGTGRRSPLAPEGWLPLWLP